ncbi:MAG: menaquinol oxidoreductase [Desulfovibrio sp.]|nr:MAG: menaquinol oxidoreductase [Desulfovibrio sp.]
MAVFISVLVVLALGCMGYLGTLFDQHNILGNIVPYAAVVIFVLGFAYRILNWARSPVPFRIPTTGGQQKSHDWIKSNPLDNPPNAGWTVVRMALEVLAFRSLFRNTSMKLHPGPRVSYASAKWLWLFAILFHYCFLVIFIRHFRFFLGTSDPVLWLIDKVEFLDGIMQIGVPRLFMSGVLILVAVGFLLGRRIFDDKVRYISQLADYFPLMLIIGVVGTGIWMRYFGKTDITAVKTLTMGLVTLSPVSDPVALKSVGSIFYIHLFLVCSLLIYFPFSKLMHMGGVFLSPTRNMPNDNRAKHHDNPWNPEPAFHTYAEYEDDFRENMIEVGLPLDNDAPVEATPDAPEETQEEQV